MVLFRMLGLPKDQPIELHGLGLKLSHKRETKNLVRWLEQELQKGEDDKVDQSVWE